MGKLASSEKPFIKSSLINLFCFLYPINLDEAERSNRKDYVSFNDFFTRKLKPDARPLSGDICSPVDGKITALGAISNNTLVQSKRHVYSLSQLIAGESNDYHQGSFVTIYLAPHNYHRVHLPRAAELDRAIYVPGNLFSVSKSTTLKQPDLFTKNERLVCYFNTDAGPMITVMVGAMLVSGIIPVWYGKPYSSRLEVTTKTKQVFAQGDELGYFQMGSTVILLFPERLDFRIREGDEVKVGQPIAW